MLMMMIDDNDDGNDNYADDSCNYNDDKKISFIINMSSIQF
jgi:hypothetical protein